MINPYRSAFGNDKKEDSIENNLEQVVNLTQAKIKELSNKHQDKLRENYALKAQASMMENDVKLFEIEISKKKETIPILKQEKERLENEIEQSEKEYKMNLREYNKKNDDFFSTMLIIEDEIESANTKNMVEETKKKSKYRIEYEKYIKLKQDNEKLTDLMFNLRKELYLIEIDYKKAADLEIQRIYQAKKGVDVINNFEV